MCLKATDQSTNLPNGSVCSPGAGAEGGNTARRDGLVHGAPNIQTVRTAQGAQESRYGFECRVFSLKVEIERVAGGCGGRSEFGSEAGAGGGR